MTVTEDEVLTSHGDKLTFGVVHKQPAVWIVAEQANKILLVHQYRYPINRDSWEIPAGHAEANSPELAARLELEEETGFTAGKLSLLGSFYLAPGHNTQQCFVYYATELSSGKQRLEPAEKGLTKSFFTRKQIDQMIKKGEIHDGPSLIALKYLDLSQTQTL